MFYTPQHTYIHMHMAVYPTAVEGGHLASMIMSTSQMNEMIHPAFSSSDNRTRSTSTTKITTILQSHNKIG